MGKKWPVQDAKSRFSELLDTTLAEGPQIVTKRGVETAILLSIEQWRRLERMTKPDLKDLLLASEARIEDLTPPRRLHRHRIPLAVQSACVSSRYKRCLGATSPPPTCRCPELDCRCVSGTALRVCRYGWRDPGRDRNHP